MYRKIRKIAYRLRYPLYWPKEVIIGVMLVQLTLVAFLVFWIAYISRKPEKPYVEKTLNSRRELIKNLKLANTQPYVWQPVLNCGSILSELHYRAGTPDKKEDQACIPVQMRFSKRGVGATNQYIRDASSNVIKYEENIEKPCLICHKSESKSSVTWVYQTSSQTSYHISQEGIQEKISTLLVICFSFIFIFWLVYLLVRLIMSTRGELDVLALSFLDHEGGLSKKTFKEMKLKKSDFLYAELSDHFLRGYIPRSTFLKWLELLIERSALCGGSQLLSKIKASVVTTPSGNNFEGMRISQLIARKAESGRIIFEQDILPDPKPQLIPAGCRKIVWKFRRDRQDNPKQYKFVDINFESMEHWVGRKLIKGIKEAKEKE